MHGKYINLLKKNNGFYELDFSDADEFIEFIRPDKINIRELMTDLRLRANPQVIESELLGKIEITTSHILDRAIVYRGHGDSQWDLVPTFYRQPCNNGFMGSYNRDIEHLNEYGILKKFQKSCDLSGVQLPFDDGRIRKNQQLKIDHFFGQHPQKGWDWFSDDFFELAVFAQHYGVPTRLLDWSMNPLVACYFACSYALNLNYQENKKISIWVLNSAELTGEMKDVLEVLDPPKGINQHISHQQGVLTYTRLLPQLGKIYGMRPKLQDILNHYDNSFRLLKINLSFDLITKLFDYCNAHNFNACHLFRGAHGAAQHTKDMMNYDAFNYYE